MLLGIKREGYKAYSQAHKHTESKAISEASFILSKKGNWLKIKGRDKFIYQVNKQ
jgi:hypothetical protein